jgi:hypothetical protein
MLFLCIYATCAVFSLDYTTPLEQQKQASAWMALFWIVVVVFGIVFWSIV